MSNDWKQYTERFETLSFRERLLIALSLSATIGVFGFMVFIEPQLTRLKNAEKQLLQQKNEISDIQQKINLTQTTAHNQDAANNAIIARTKSQIDDINTRLSNISQTLVGPEKINGLLEEILKSNNHVQLIALRNLPPTLLIETKPKDVKDSPAQSSNALPLNEKNRIESLAVPLFKHGVEITVEGSYNDLLAYLIELEKMPQHLLWNSVDLSVESYPRTKMTLTLYTLSFDKVWLRV